ncbi:ABC transporter permease [Brevibacillus sp. NRS-1366]|uniref:ABC transporter permease n=1 Tax=Brevibacillus sp. NRS-1366 TaxID=3233899 RepID=UPI003D197AE3
MIAIWKYAVVEWKLMFRGWFGLILLAVTGGVFAISLINNAYADDIGWYTISSSYKFMWFMFMMAPFLAVSAARRDTVAKTRPIQGALPYRSVQLISARLLALIIPLGALSLLPACFYAYHALRAGMAFSSMAMGLSMLGSFVIPTTFTILLGYWIGTWTRNRIVYLYSLAIVAAVLFLANVIFLEWIPAQWTYLVDIGLTDLTRLGFYSELWGFTDAAAYGLLRLFHTALIVLLFGGIVYSAKRGRKEKSRNTVLYPISAAAVVTMVMSVLSYASIWKERTESSKENFAFYRKLLQENPSEINRIAVERFLAGEEADPNVNPLTQQYKNMLLLGRKYAMLTALKYDLKVNIGEKHRMEVRSAIQLQHGGQEAIDRFPLSLRHHFQINEIKVEGMPAAFEWEPGEDVVWVVPARPVQPRTVVETTMEYAGTINDWYDPQGSGGIDDSLDAHWERRVFVDPEKLFLPGYYGWYPYPGTDRLAELEQVHFDERLSSPVVDEAVRESEPYRLPADFHVEVEAGERMQLIANGERTNSQVADGRQRVVFDASGVRGFNLIGGNMTEWRESNNQATVSIVLSNQIPPARAKSIAGNLLVHYTELSQIAKMLNPDAFYPSRIHFIRTDYPGRVQNESFNNQLLFRSPLIKGEFLKPIDSNGFNYLSYSNHPASMTFNGLSYFDEDLLRATLLDASVMSVPLSKLAGYMTEAISQSIRHNGTEQDEPLFIPSRHKWNGSPHPVYLAMNKVYEAFGKERFPEAIRQIYEYARRYEGNEQDVDKDFIMFLNSLAP